MEFIFELIGEFIIEGAIDISKNNKVNKWIRYSLITLVLMFLFGVTTCLIIFGLFLMNEKSIMAGAMIFVVVMLMVIGIYKFIKKIKQ